MTSALHTRDELDLAVSQERGSGPHVLFQHGLCGDAAQPAEVFPSDTGARRVTLECRGHGASPLGPVKCISIATFTDDVACLTDRLASEPIVVGGISMGAAVALRLAIRKPAAAKALVIARPAWMTEAAPANMAPNALVGELLASYSANEARARFEASTTAATLAAEAPDNLASLRGFFSRVPQAGTATLLARISADGPGITAEDLAAIRIPTLIIAHGRDHVHPLSMAQELARAIPSARLVEITPKAEDRTRYVAEFQSALRMFLRETIA